MSPEVSDLTTSNGTDQKINYVPQNIVSNISVNPAHSSKSKRYYLTNLAGVSLAIFCTITASSILYYIQSSLHSKGGLGNITLAVDYASQLTACFFLPPFVMRMIGCKWSLVLSFIIAAVFMVANLAGSFETLIPAAVLLGVGRAIMWGTMNTVVSDLASGYARLIGRPVAAILSQFFSFFFVFINMAAILANIISSLILSPQVMVAGDNSSELHETCGAQYCAMDENTINAANSSLNSTKSTEVPWSEVRNLVIASLSIDGLAIVVLLVLLKSYQTKKLETTESPLIRLLATAKLLRNPNLLLLINATINSGLMFSLFSGDFTKAFVTCSIGIHNVGWVTSSLGITMTIGTAILVFVAPLIPRMVLFLGAAALNVTGLIIMLCWIPEPHTTYVFYIIAAIWGLTFAIWSSQLLALYGDAFPSNHQEAYSNHRTWECVGYVIGYAWGHYLCMYIKIYIVLASLTTGTLGYILIERRLTRRRQLTDK